MAVSQEGNGLQNVKGTCARSKCLCLKPSSMDSLARSISVLKPVERQIPTRSPLISLCTEMPITQWLETGMRGLP